MINLLVIEDSTIRAMMADPRYLELLPCLGTAKNQLESVNRGKRNCQRCTAEKTQIVSDAVNQAKVCIHSTRGAKLTQLKKLLNARQLRLITTNGRGRRVKYTL